jgi:hypothetical protein
VLLLWCRGGAVVLWCCGGFVSNMFLVELQRQARKSLGATKSFKLNSAGQR